MLNISIYLADYITMSTKKTSTGVELIELFKNTEIKWIALWLIIVSLVYILSFYTVEICDKKSLSVFIGGADAFALIAFNLVYLILIIRTYVSKALNKSTNEN